MKTPIEEIIGCQSWYNLCDYEYDNVTEYPSGIIHCHMDHIDEFFEKIKNNGEEYVVLSTRSDYGVCYQQQFPVWQDAHKAIKMSANPEWEYNTINLKPRCDVENCRLSDKYSIKMYMWTKATFNEIPKNVKRWYCTNCCINEPNVEGLPFGISDSGGNTQFYDFYKNVELKSKSKLLYVNFQFYTNERIDLFKYFYGCNNVTVEKDKLFEHYMDQLNQHHFCLCPVGNGIDCYRIWEALYMGCIPIIELHPGFIFLHDTRLPILVVDNFYRITNKSLTNFLNANTDQLELLWQSPYMRFSHWKNKINDYSNNL